MIRASNLKIQILLLTAVLLSGTGLQAMAQQHRGGKRSSGSCGCGRVSALSVSSRDGSWRKLLTVKEKSKIEIAAEGKVWHDKNRMASIQNFFVDLGKDVVGQVVSYYCPLCGVGVGLLDMTHPNFLHVKGLDKLSDAYGEDPRRWQPGQSWDGDDRTGSKKVGGLLLSMGKPGARRGSCPCSANNVYHLVRNGRRRFAEYAKHHRFITPAQLSAGVFGPGTLYVNSWDKDFSDNQGDYGVAARVIRDSVVARGLNAPPPSSASRENARPSPQPEKKSKASKGKKKNRKESKSKRKKGNNRKKNGKKGKGSKKGKGGQGKNL